MVGAVQYASLPGVISTEQALTTTAFSGKGHVMARRIIIAPPPKDKRFIDLTGRVFGQLTVIAHHGHYFLNHRGRDFKKQVWRCLCSCGAEVIRESGPLLQGAKQGRDQSCGAEVHNDYARWIASGERPCRSCGQVKPLSAFPKKHGLPQSKCKTCFAEWFRGYYVSGGYERIRKYQKDNHDRLRQQRKVYEKLPHVRERIASYSATPEFKEARSAYKKSPRGKRQNALHKAIRRARQAGLPDAFSAADMAAASQYWDNRCATCRIPLGLVAKTHWDHWVPMSDTKCPGTIPENMLPLCGSCNMSKSDRDGEEWARDKFGTKARGILRNIKLFFRSRRSSR